ncbi:MAG TPA: substrate-binding domain-containing protein [Chthoniobacterales bacterium]
MRWVTAVLWILPLSAALRAADSPRLVPKSCQTGTPLIGVALPNTTNPYYVAMRQGFIDGAKELGFQVNVQIANDDNEAQLAQVQGFVQQGVCAVALNGVKSGPAAAEVAAAFKAGIPVFTVNVIVSEKDVTAQKAEIVDYVGADNFTGGKQIGEQVLKDYGPDAKLVIGIVTEPNEIPTVQRTKGFKSAFSGDANVKFVQEVNGLVKPDVSLQKTTEMLQAHPDINLIWADTGPAAQGALRAVKSLKSSAKVYGFAIADFPTEAQYPAAAAQEPYQYAKIVLQQIRDYLDGKPVPKEVLRPLKIIKDGKPAPGEVG